jgi:hypothetical protein
MAPQLDHIVILVPHSTLLSPPPWINSNFTLSPGGRHGDSKTENKLIVFRDGSYLELIAFIDDSPAHRSGHFWDRPFGIIDYAFTTTADDFDEQYAGIVERLEGNDLGVSFVDPKSGSRLREDGERISWKVTFPSNIPRGQVPFWVHDVTPRSDRVPSSPSATTHPCGAVGISRLTTMVPPSQAPAFASIYTSIINAPSDKLPFHAGSWQIDTVVPCDGKPHVTLWAPDGGMESERKAAAAVARRGAYISGVMIAIERGGEKRNIKVDDEGLQHLQLVPYFERY